MLHLVSIFVYFSWDTGVGGLVFTPQFLQIATRLPSENIYGLGENLHFHLRHDLNFQTWPLWARDQPPGSGDDTYVSERSAVLYGKLVYVNVLL